MRVFSKVAVAFNSRHNARMHRSSPAVEDSRAEGAQEGTADVIRVLLENRPKFLGFVKRYVGCKHAAEDILQEVLARGIHRIDSVRNDELVVAWFYRALRNAVRDYYRCHKTTTRGLQALAQEIERTQSWEEQSGEGVCKCVGRLAAELKPEYAEALQRIEVEGVLVKDFAEERGLSSGNAAVRVFRARDALRRAVLSCCGECAMTGCRNCCCGDTTAAGTKGSCGVDAATSRTSC